MADDSINLMPEDLRQKEQEVAAKQKSLAAEPDLFVPGKFAPKKEDKKDLSGSKPSFLANLSNLFRKAPKPASNDIIPPVKSSPLSNQREPFHIVKQARPQSSPELDLNPIIPPLPTARPIPTPPPAPTPFQPIPTPPPSMPTSEIKGSANESKFHQPEKIIRAKFIEEGSGVNLVPSSTQVKNWKQISTLMITAFIGSVAIVAIFYFAFLVWDQTIQSNRTETIKNISEIEEKLLSLGNINKEINKKGREISLVYEVLGKHIYWTNFFRLLEKYTVEDVYFTSFSAGNGGAMTLSAVGKNYEAVGRQLKILQQEKAKEFATEVDISSASLSGTNGVAFSITLVLNPDLFYYQSGL